MKEVVIVTGASSGIGAATARLLGAAGASVVVNYRNSQDLAESVAADVIAAGGRSVAIKADMGDEADIVRLFEETDRTFGGVTGLVNNAAINGPALRRLEDYTFKEIMDILAGQADEGRTVLATTHDLMGVAHRFQDVVGIHHAVVAHGPASLVLDPDFLARTYGHHLLIVDAATGRVAVDDAHHHDDAAPGERHFHESGR